MDSKPTQEERERAKESQKCENQWVALVEEKVVAASATMAEVAQKAEAAGYPDYAFYLVPSGKVRLALYHHGVAL
jgi:hypothetical protein